MNYKDYYNSPLGKILITADDTGLTGLFLESQIDKNKNFQDYKETDSCVILNKTKEWLDIYFSGQIPPFTPKLNFIGTTFQLEVWDILCSIPYGKTMSYRQIADMIAEKRHIRKMSAQAVGNAVGKNPISIIVPCHRVIGSNGALTGYTGGLDKKTYLLNLESGENFYS